MKNKAVIIAEQGSHEVMKIITTYMRSGFSIC